MKDVQVGMRVKLCISDDSYAVNELSDGHTGVIAELLEDGRVVFSDDDKDSGLMTNESFIAGYLPGTFIVDRSNLLLAINT